MICSKGPATVQWARPMEDQAVPRPVNFNSNVLENATCETSGQIRTTALGIAPVSYGSKTKDGLAAQPTSFDRTPAEDWSRTFAFTALICREDNHQSLGKRRNGRRLSFLNQSLH